MLNGRAIDRNVTQRFQIRGSTASRRPPWFHAKRGHTEVQYYQMNQMCLWTCVLLESVR